MDININNTQQLITDAYNYITQIKLTTTEMKCNKNVSYALNKSR